MHDSMPEGTTAETADNIYRVGCRFCGGRWEYPTADAARQHSIEHAELELARRRRREFARPRAVEVSR
jgi:hypothetical protein